MDDFGTGYSSLSFLAELPIDILKVAKPFTEGLGRSERDTAFAEAIVPLGRTVGMQINAETPSPATRPTSSICCASAPRPRTARSSPSPRRHHVTV